MTTDTIGPQRVADVRGWLTFEYLPPDLQRAEDATQAADFARQGNAHWVGEYDPVRGRTVLCFHRHATDAERILLVHLGYALPAELDTAVSYITETLRRRTWPQLEGSTS